MFQILMVQSSEPVKRKFPSRAMQEMASLWQNQILCPIGSGHVSCASSSRSSLLNHVGAVVLGPSVADYNRSFDNSPTPTSRHSGGRCARCGERYRCAFRDTNRSLIRQRLIIRSLPAVSSMPLGLSCPSKNMCAQHKISSL